jgi:hypothetical protein
VDPNNPFDNPTPQGPSNNPWDDQQRNNQEQPPQPFFQGPPQYQNPYGNPNAPYQPQEQVPNSVLILVFGIVGLVFSCLSILAIVALVLNIVNLTLASKARKLHQAEPTRYAPGSVTMMNAGRICSIIGLCLGSLAVIFLVVYFVFLGLAISEPGIFD